MLRLGSEPGKFDGFPGEIERKREGAVEKKGKEKRRGAKGKEKRRGPGRGGWVGSEGAKVFSAVDGQSGRASRTWEPDSFHFSLRC